MQVKKFEAATMKEALAMVKSELGPEAIILSAKDNSQNYGLKGKASVEITAAISEKMLQKKKLAENKLSTVDKAKYQQSSAHVQKQFIEKTYQKTIDEHRVQTPKANITTPLSNANRPPTNQRYIDISDDGGGGMMMHSKMTSKAPQGSLGIAKANNSLSSRRLHETESEITGLKTEIQRLKQVIAEFQKMPQSFIAVHPGAEKGVSFEFSAIFEKLHGVGIGEDTVLQMIDLAKQQMSTADQRKKHLVDAWTAQEILRTTQVAEDPYEGFLHVFVGASGQGKTSSLVKMASHLVIEKNKKIALITADTFKVGAADQLRIFAQILNVPFAAVRSPQDWQQVLHELADYDHLLFDFPSLQMRDGKDLDLVHQLMPPMGPEKKVHLVVSASSKTSDAEEMARRFRVFSLNDVIFTKLDESTQHGLIYDFQRKFALPLHSFGVGSRIPEDFELASRERVLDLLFRLTKMNSDKEI